MPGMLAAQSVSSPVTFESPPGTFEVRKGAAAAQWSWTAGTREVDWITRVVQARNGDVVAVGFVNRSATADGNWDAVAMRFDANRRVRWAKRFGGTALDAFWDVRETREGHLAITGFSASGSAGAADAWLVVVDSGGELLVDQRYGTAKEDRGMAIAIAPEGGYLIAGQTEGEGAGERDVWLVRTDNEGRELWRRAIGTPGVDRGFFVERTSGGYVVSGVTGSEGNYDLLVLKVGDRGEEVWRRVIGAAGNDPNHGLNVFPDGRIVVAGYTQSWGAQVHDVVAITLASNGEVLNQQMLGGPGDDRVMSSLSAPDGTTWLVGYTRSDSTRGWDILVAHLRADGTFEPWLGAIDGGGADHAYHGVLLANRQLLVAGYSTSPSQAQAPADLLLAAFATERIERSTAQVRTAPIP